MTRSGLASSAGVSGDEPDEQPCEPETTRDVTMHGASQPVAASAQTVARTSAADDGQHRYVPVTRYRHIVRDADRDESRGRVGAATRSRTSVRGVARIAAHADRR